MPPEIVLLESVGKILAGIVGVSVFILAATRGTIKAHDWTTRTYVYFRGIWHSLAELGPFIQRTDALAAEFPKLAARVARIEEAVGPNGGKSLIDGMTRLEISNAFIHHAVAMDQPHPTFRTDAAGQCSWVNDKYSELVGLPAERLLGNGWISCIAEPDRDRVTTEWERCVEYRRVFRMRFNMVLADAALMQVHCTALPVQARGDLQGFFGRLETLAKLRGSLDS